LVPSIKKTAKMVQEVATASREQSVSVAQVNKAMAQVDQVTQRNASSAEEQSSTAEEMEAQARNLEELIGFFEIAGAKSFKSTPTKDGLPTGPFDSQRISRTRPATASLNGRTTAIPPPEPTTHERDGKYTHWA
jgi:methyl-accepting chemotaxis protein